MHKAFLVPQQEDRQDAMCLPSYGYLNKNDSTKKDRCICNGSPSQKGSVTLAHTYAAALNQSGKRTFWAITALNNYVAYDADATNAFGEDHPPTVPFYVTIDAPLKS